MWQASWRPSWTKSCRMTHHFWVFEKALYLTLLQLMDYHKQQQSQFVRVRGLQKLMQKFGLCLHLEMVDVHSCFGLNSIKTCTCTWIAPMRNYFKLHAEYYPVTLTHCYHFCSLRVLQGLYYSQRYSGLCFEVKSFLLAFYNRWTAW